MRRPVYIAPPARDIDSVRRLVGMRLVSLLKVGTHRYSQNVQSRLLIVNLLAFLIFLVSLNYALVYALTDLGKYAIFVLFNVALALMALSVPLFHRISDIAGGLMVAFFEYTGLFVLTALLGRDTGIQMNYIIGAAVPFLCFGLHAIRLILTIVFLGFLLHLIAWFSFPPERALFESEPILVSNVYVFSAITVFVLTSATVYYAFYLKEQAEAKTEALLQNMLPSRIAEALRDNPEAGIAENYDKASVMFADLVGFTSLAQDIGAKRTVTLLNDVFTAFDLIADELQVEKIKTIGDAYMVAGGVLTADDDHPARVAEMALRMQETVHALRAETGYALQLRIGIAHGPLLAGVIGKRKPAYDVWGDTVNLAAHLETSGDPGMIHITPAFAERIATGFHCSPRGEVPVKGFGTLVTWRLVGRRDQAGRQGSGS